MAAGSVNETGQRPPGGGKICSWLRVRRFESIKIQLSAGLPRVQGFQGGASGKEPSWQWRRCEETRVWSLGWDDPLGMVTQSSVLAWRIPWAEEPGRLRSMESQRVRHTWSNLACMQGREERPWQVFLGSLSGKELPQDHCDSFLTYKYPNP